jgi:outer membrane protein TolC
LHLPPGRLWDLPIQPTTEPQTEERPDIDIEDAIQIAFNERPEIHQQQLAIDQSRLNAAFFRNQKKPRLDLTVSYGATGAQPQYSDVFSTIFGFNFVGWSAQLDFAYPIQNRAARARSARADIEVERTNTELADLEESVRTEVRQTARRVETALKAIDAARASVRYSVENLEAERKRYENGMSSAFQITQIQDALTLARSREVNAIISYRTALTDYYRAIGRLLEREGIEVVDPEHPIRRFTLF